MSRPVPAVDRPWRDQLAWVRAELQAAEVDAADAEARWLVEQASGLDAFEWITGADAIPPERAARRLRSMLARRLDGEPLQYVLGAWPFRRLDLMVDPRVLVPRPETEVVVDVALAEADRLGIRRRTHRRGAPPPGAAVAVDLGTGSGAIGLSLATELVVEVWATDASAEALVVARANAAGNAVQGVHFAHGAWFGALPSALRGRCALIVSNPPYVSEGEVASLPPEVRDHEPLGALVSGPTGREDLEHIVEHAPGWLAPGGALVVEIAPHQADEIASTASAAGLVDVCVHADLADRARAVVGRRA